MPGGRGPKKAATNPAGPRSADGGYVPTQPVRPIPAERHGERQASVDLQQSAPMVDATAPGAQPPAPMPPGAAAHDPFGPSRRPNEPITAGARLGPGRMPDAREDMRAFAAALYQEYGLDEFLDMIEALDEELGYA